MKRIIALALTLMMVLSLAACGGKSDSAPSDSASSDASSSTADVKAVKLNLSVPDAESSSIGVAAAEFAKELNEKSEGRLDVKVYYNGELYGGDATAAVTTMQDGGLDIWHFHKRKSILAEMNIVPAVMRRYNTVKAN